VPRGTTTIADTVLALLREHGPQDVDALVGPIVEAGLTKSKDPRRAVQQAIGNRSWQFLTDWQGRWCSLVDQLEGAVFTHRLTTLERRDEIVVLGPDLRLIERLAAKGRPIAHGGEAHLDFLADFFELPNPYDLDPDGGDDPWGALDDETQGELTGFVRELGAPYDDLDDEEAVAEFLEANRYARILHGPPLWLPPLVGDQLLGLGIRGGTIEPLIAERRSLQGPHVGIVGAQVARLAKLVIGPDPSWFGPPAMALEELLELVATEAPEVLRRPLPPFSEVVERGGLEVVGGFVGHSGTNWDELFYGLDPDPEGAWGFSPSRTLVH
jgi:hypothetical protein